MATRPFAFGARFRSGQRTVRVHGNARDARYTVEVQRDRSPARKTEHGSLPSALAHFARSWRNRLN